MIELGMPTEGLHLGFIDHITNVDISVAVVHQDWHNWTWNTVSHYELSKWVYGCNPKASPVHVSFWPVNALPQTIR